MAVIMERNAVDIVEIITMDGEGIHEHTIFTSWYEVNYVSKPDFCFSHVSVL